MQIRAFIDADLEAIVQLSLAAWVPVFASFRQVLGPRIYPLIWPDWRKSQAEAVEKVCKDEKTHTLVAEVDGEVVGFLVYVLREQDKAGEVWLLAVEPGYQNQGIGTELNAAALREMRAAGMSLAEVETGGDGGHAPARRCYEKAGYKAMPLVRYFKEL
jgi:ribosomal protein S18 acetylase RimI-like enzyme